MAWAQVVSIAEGQEQDRIESRWGGDSRTPPGVHSNGRSLRWLCYPQCIMGSSIFSTKTEVVPISCSRERKKEGLDTVDMCSLPLSLPLPLPVPVSLCAYESSTRVIKSTWAGVRSQHYQIWLS